MSRGKIIAARIIAAVVAVALIIGCVYVAVSSMDSGKRPAVTISLKVIDGDENSMQYKFKTDCIYLKDVLLTDGFAAGEDREEGFWITRVADIEAPEDDHWQIHIGGKLTAKKADKIKIEDGAEYTLKLITEGEEVENANPAG